MEPTYKAGQIVLFVRHRKYKIGDVVLIKHGGLEKIKRIHEIGKKGVVVAGDNVYSSTDSRHFGPIKPGVVLGRAVL